MVLSPVSLHPRTHLDVGHIQELKWYLLIEIKKNKVLQKSLLKWSLKWKLQHVKRTRRGALVE